VYIEDVQKIEFNSDAFSTLILLDEQKDMIHSLVEVHSKNLLTFDDVIAGKGKGMVFLLHGECGTGKTLTAGKTATLTSETLLTR
jgi:ATP-dependent 26S proteasome regulatory subunit